MYSEKVMDHFQHPRNVGEIENASGVGTVGNAKCGDIMRIFLDIDDETHIIKDCKFKTHLSYEYWMCNIDESIKMDDESNEFRNERCKECPLIEIKD